MSLLLNHLEYFWNDRGFKIGSIANVNYNGATVDFWKHCCKQFFPVKAVDIRCKDCPNIKILIIRSFFLFLLQRLVLESKGFASFAQPLVLLLPLLSFHSLELPFINEHRISCCASLLTQFIKSHQRLYVKDLWLGAVSYSGFLFELLPLKFTDYFLRRPNLFQVPDQLIVF